MLPMETCNMSDGTEVSYVDTTCQELSLPEEHTFAQLFDWLYRPVVDMWSLPAGKVLICLMTVLIFVIGLMLYRARSNRYITTK